MLYLQALLILRESDAGITEKNRSVAARDSFRSM
jgi:hypothetical protein